MIFTSTLSQMAFLFTLIAAGYLLMRLRAVADNAERVLSGLENALFIPALVLSTFLGNFTIEKMGSASRYLLTGLGVALVSVPVALLLARVCTRDDYERRLYTYGLAFSNFGFMGNAVVMALFPDVFMEYLIFVLPFWALIYLWGVPALLIPAGEGKGTLKSRLRNMLNPMMVATLLGMALGLINPPLPAFLTSALNTLGGCMSPIAMLLTGMTLAKLDLKAMLTRRSTYVATLFRLLVIPLVCLGVLSLVPVEYGLAVCILCALSMPLGLNTIIVPSAYGQDPSVGSGMALISHVLSCLTIPMVFALFEQVMALHG